MGSDLDTVMSSIRQTDEKYQDASVSVINLFSLAFSNQRTAFTLRFSLGCTEVKTHQNFKASYYSNTYVHHELMGS